MELGSFADELRRRFHQAWGADAWNRRFSSVAAMWEALRSTVRTLPLEWTSTRLYQDGLPVCGREHDIVRDLAGMGSQNHQLLLELVGRGATLMGTESPELLMQEYRRGQQLIQAAKTRAPISQVDGLRREGERILRERDAAIARRIDSTLEDGETGLLFIGLLHRAHELLEGKLELQHLDHHLPLGTIPWRQMTDRSGHGG
jgi:hypothetical protein